uniref:mitogen-activated protein kinase kinase n=1 Tax=Wuchereria bancrofti TaxID=6293 RepID=A0AAF5PKA2_WUCBA
MEPTMSLHQRIREFECRIRRWKQVRFAPLTRHVFASRRSSSVEPQVVQVSRPFPNPSCSFPPQTNPLPRRNMADGAPRRNLPELPTTISQSSPVSTADDALTKRLAEIKRLSGRITIMKTRYETTKESLKRIGELGSGTCGVVYKARFEQTGTIMAVKQMVMTSVAEENKRVLMDLEVVLRSHDCPHIVRCYGCFITDFEVLICMELMATCLDKLSKRVQGGFPEDILGKMAVSIIKALDYLKVTQNIIHRDVKPSNILLDLNGTVKLCDFGIAGRLVDSMARTRTAGCSAYMSPERLEAQDEYDVRADVWSIGISLVELAKGEYPYRGCNSEFEVLSRIVSDPAPMLHPEEGFSPMFCDFLRLCLTKNYQFRPKYKELLQHEWVVHYETARVDVAGWYQRIQS